MRALGLFMACALLALALFSCRMGKRIPAAQERFYFVPSSAYLIATSGTYRPLIAYLFFIRGVLDISEDLPASVDRMDYLLRNFQASLSLEPGVEGAYLFGGVVAPRNSQDLKKANLFLMQGLKNRPNDWKIPFWIGFNHVQAGNYSQAVEFYKSAAALPASPAYLKTNLAYLYYKSGGAAEGILYLRGLLLSVDNERVKELLTEKIKWLQQIAFLEDRVKEYRRRFGSWPDSLQSLREQGLIRAVPEDEFGSGFYLEKGNGAGMPKVKSRQ